MNRKLIRTTLADVKARREATHQRDRINDRPNDRSNDRPNDRSNGGGAPRPGLPQHRPPQPSSIQVRKRQPPPAETHAEIYYYKKQIDAHTEMVLVLQDGEEIEGTIEWYDRSALKINRRSAPNLLVLKRNIKYIFKAEDRVPQGAHTEPAARMEEEDGEKVPHDSEP